MVLLSRAMLEIISVTTKFFCDLRSLRAVSATISLPSDWHYQCLRLRKRTAFHFQDCINQGFRLRSLYRHQHRNIRVHPCWCNLFETICTSRIMLRLPAKPLDFWSLSRCWSFSKPQNLNNMRIKRKQSEFNYNSSRLVMYQHLFDISCKIRFSTISTRRRMTADRLWWDMWTLTWKMYGIRHHLRYVWEGTALLLALNSSEVLRRNRKLKKIRSEHEYCQQLVKQLYQQMNICWWG